MTIILLYKRVLISKDNRFCQAESHSQSKNLSTILTRDVFGGKKID